MSGERDQNQRLQREQLFNQNYSVAAFYGSKEVWKQFKKSVTSIYDENIIPILQDYHQDWLTTYFHGHNDKNLLKKDLHNSTTIFVALTDRKTNDLVGFTYACPASLTPDSYIANEEFATMAMTSPEYENRQRKTAEVGWTIIQKQHRSKGGWSHMMGVLEEKLKEKGYEEMIRVVRTANNYADGKVRGRYGDKIITELPVKLDLGPQVYFRIRL